jgi:hypothetical protein
MEEKVTKMRGLRVQYVNKGPHSISHPSEFKSHINVKLDEDGKFVGLPEMWVELLEISPELAPCTQYRFILQPRLYNTGQPKF